MRCLIDIAIVAITMTSISLAGCEKQVVQKPSEHPSFQAPRATEVFDLRSRCAELGEVLLTEEKNGTSAALNADTKSHYDPKTNRCYVLVEIRTTDDVYSPNYQVTYRLYDGQTKENLAWYKTKGAVDSKDDKCVDEGLDMPFASTCQQIAHKMGALMYDDRKE